MKIRIVNWYATVEKDRRRLLRRPAVNQQTEILAQVVDIVEQVKANGDEALRELTAAYDGVRLQSLKVSKNEFDSARTMLRADQVAAIELAMSNVRKFHELQRPVDLDTEIVPGVRCQRICQPLDAIGLYVPAGSAPLPSTAIMLAIPAAIAGCPIRVLCTPPGQDGCVDPSVLLVAEMTGIDRVYKIGGAQAIAALAYGTQSVPQVNRIFGPGNAWVTAAKNLVSRDPEGSSIDIPAGPSEVMVIADETANPSFVAADLLSQAEHDPSSHVLLVSTSENVVRAVAKEVQVQSRCLARATIVNAALRSCVAILVTDISQAIQIANDYAPEHLILQIQAARKWLTSIRNAGSVFLGPWSPESAGDYCSGTNHVLPTYGAARAYSGLGVDQFMRHMTVQELSADGLQSLAPTIETLASMEGLDAHANAVRVRLAQMTAEALVS